MDNIVIENFEGPLDLLLSLIKKEKKDILEINLSDITEKYLDYLTKMKELNLDIAGEYLIIASELVEIKSKKLLPYFDEPNEENVDIEENLKNRLIEYEKYKKSKEIFVSLALERSEYLTKAPEKKELYSNKKIINNGTITKYDLLESLKLLIERQLYKKPLNTKITLKEISIKEEIDKIRKLIKENKRIEFLKMFGNNKKENIVVSFLSILEMAKNNEIYINQKENFGKIYLERVI